MAISLDDFDILLSRLEERRAEERRQDSAIQQQLMKEMLAGVMGGSSRGGLVDSRGIGRPSTFRGDESKYIEWVAKLNAYLKSANDSMHHWLEWAGILTVIVDHDAIVDAADTFQADQRIVQGDNAKLYSILISSTEDDAFRLVNSIIPGNGFESDRLLKIRVRAESPGHEEGCF